MTTSYASMGTFSKIALLLFMIITLYFVETGWTPFSFSRPWRWTFTVDKKKSAIDYYVYRLRLLLHVCWCWRSRVINCIVNFQLEISKGKTSFCGFLMFCCSILTVLQRLLEQYRKMYESDWFWLDRVSPHLLIDDVSTSFGVIVKLWLLDFFSCYVSSLLRWD